MDNDLSIMISCMEIGERITIAREHAKMGKADLARAIGVSRQAVGAMENGGTKDPKPGNIFNIAKATGVNIEWLIFGRGEMLAGAEIAESPTLYSIEQKKDYSLRRIAMLDDKEAIEWQDNYIPKPQSERDAPPSFVQSDAPERVFGIIMKGDTMTSQGKDSIPDGAVVVIDPDREAQDGAIVAAFQGGTEQVLIKQLIIDGPNRYLTPLNKQYSPIKMDETFEIIGVVYQSSQTTMHVSK